MQTDIMIPTSISFPGIQITSSSPGSPVAHEEPDERFEFQRPLFEDPRAGRTDAKRKSFAMLDLWRVYLDQCPECGHVHKGAGPSSRPERHIYEYIVGTVCEDLICVLCGEVFQSPVFAPCGHHFCSICVRALLSRAAGKAACPLDGQLITRFAVRSAEQRMLERLDNLLVRCPVCREEIRKVDLELHLQDPVNMVEEPLAYERILRPFYMSCPLSNFTVGEFNGSAALIRFYRRLGEQTLRRFVLTTRTFIILPDPKMGFQPHTDEDFDLVRRQGGYFNAWWVHPRFRSEVWWRGADEEGDSCLVTANSETSPSSSSSKADAPELLLGGQDCSSEPWSASSFVHTWSAVRKPSRPRYLCCLRDLRGEDVPMLEEFQCAVVGFLQETYNVAEKDVRIFAHYPSSARYSTLHFHIVFGGRGSRYEKFAKKLERPHQLSRQFCLPLIIERLKHDPLHFERCTLNYYLGDKADLMDPISAFFGRSPHRYLQNFTFHWDPGIVSSTVPGTAQAWDGVVGEKTVSSGGGGGGVGKHECANVQSALIAAVEERNASKVPSELVDIRQALEGMRRAVEDLGKVLHQVAEHQRLEQTGASRLAMLLAGDSQRPYPSAQLHVGSLPIVKAFIGGSLLTLIVAGAAARVLALRTSRP